MKLERLANDVVAVVAVDDPIDLAIRHMWQMNIRHLPVVRKNIPVGMVSERDVLFHVCWLDHTNPPLGNQRESPLSGATRIEQIMTRPVVVLSPDDTIENAARLMVNKRISSVPLVTQNNIVGIITETDLLRCYSDPACFVPSQKSRQRSVLELMSASVHSVRPDDATLAAIRLMREKQIRHVVVMDDDELVGIVSDRDVLRGSPRAVGDHAISARELRLLHKRQVEGIMSSRPEVISLDATAAQAAQVMATNKIGALPVVEDGTLSGIITETDLLRAMVADCN